MTLTEILMGSGGGLLLLLSLIQIAPIKINPWSAIARTVGRALNGDVMKKLESIETESRETKAKLQEHIAQSDEQAADHSRQRLLRFNDELKRDMRHTEEHFNEVLSDIDKYEEYCRTHEEYKNSKAVHAIANILRVYDDRLKNNDFL